MAVPCLRIETPALRDPTMHLCHEAGKHQLYLDLGAVAFVTAGGLGKLVTLHKELRAVGGELILCNVSPGVHEVFALTRLTEVLDVRPSWETVLPPGPPCR